MFLYFFIHPSDIYNLVFDIYNYYDAWSLRGDSPELYQNGYFLDLDDGFSILHYMKNRKYPVQDNGEKNSDIRMKPEVFLLYYCYHYNHAIKEAGSRMTEIVIKKPYIDAVKAIQKAMQFCVAQNGIAIETNPSSNYLIGTFKDYSKHPIIQFYNKELVNDPDKLDSCAQIPVSINTDDSGVFNTSLMNEYALIASALESVVNEKGQRLYNRTSIYQWLDSIRQMGNAQCFKWDITEETSDRRYQTEYAGPDAPGRICRTGCARQEVPDRIRRTGCARQEISDGIRQTGNVRQETTEYHLKYRCKRR